MFIYFYLLFFNGGRCYECATYIIWGPKATIYSTGTGANIQEAPHMGKLQYTNIYI
jgi:hypothetical protein